MSLIFFLSPHLLTRSHTHTHTHTQVCFEFVTNREEDALLEHQQTHPHPPTHPPTHTHKTVHLTPVPKEEGDSDSNTHTHTHTHTHEEEEEEEEDESSIDEEEERYEKESGCPDTLTPTHTSKLRWDLPVRVCPPTDTDATDLFLEYDIARCATELYV
jgi:hypothetical protein